MVAPCVSARPLASRAGSLVQLKLWQLAVLVAFVGIAIADIQAHGHHDPFLIGLATVGYTSYGLLCWLAWHGMGRFRGRLGLVPLAACYASLMGAVFLTAVIAYLLIEYVYLGGSMF